MTKLCAITSLILLTLFALHQKALPRLLLLKAAETSKWHCVTTQKDLDEVKEILQKPLKFLGLGSQCFAFASENDDHVVKICKATRYKPFSNPKKKEKLETDFLSYHLAFNLIPTQSQIVFLHLSNTQTLNTTIKIIDPLGLPHYLNADHLAIYIQKKATPLSSHLQNLPVSEADLLIKKLLYLFQSSCQAGLQVRDLHPKNIGIYQGSPLWIDPGRIRKKTTLLNKDEQEKALRRFSTRITPFLSSFDPSFQALLEKELEHSL